MEMETITRELMLPTVLLSGAALLSACNSPGKPSENKEEKPNIVFILADDMGYNELGCYGQDMFETPNIDQLAREGMRFTSFYAGNSVSAPSRCNLLTGKHPGNAAIRGNKAIVNLHPVVWDRVGITANDTTFAELLKKEGYKTALCGKWHLEYKDDSLLTWPKYRGFDYVIRERWNKEIISQWNEWSKSSGVPRDQNYPHELYENGKRIEIPGNIEGKRVKFLDDINYEKGVEFIKKHKDEPFMVFFSMKIPHAPEVLEKLKGKYADKGWPETERVHAARIYYLDSLVGKIVNTIDDLGLAEETLIIYTSDNGSHAEGDNLPTGEIVNGFDPSFFKSTGPLRGIKRDLYEGGIRVPFIVRWKENIQPNTISDHIAAFWDILPTFADVAGVNTTYNHDGISFLPELTGKKQPKHDHLYWEFQLDGSWQELPDGGFRQAVRMGNWKAVRYGIHEDIELYNLSEDIGEQEDLSGKFPEMVLKMDSIFKVSRTVNKKFPYGGTLANH